MAPCELGLAPPPASDASHWRVLELFAGIGGMRIALAEGGVNAEVVAAYEISEVCERTYLHNFPDELRVWRRSTIERVSAAELDSLSADVWLMSPPCQPFTRSGQRLDEKDNRTQALLHLADLLLQLRRLPKYILLENVVGFERSESRRRFFGTLAKLGWEVAELDLRPEDVGLPNSRPRYYGLFRTPPSSAAECIATAHLRWRPASEAQHDEAAELQRCPDAFKDHGMLHCPPLGSFLQCAGEVACEEAELGCSIELPQEAVAAHVAGGGRYDINLRSEITSACFTKGYGRFPRGYGPFVLIDSEDEASVIQSPKLSADAGSGSGGAPAMYNVWREGSRLRYLTPTEQLRLMGYPAWYKFPKRMSMRERCALIGNSVNARVVGRLLRYVADAEVTPHNARQDESCAEMAAQYAATS
mmetsp:Transcript_28965/g.79768  ORF Transcript_28965/g.79768 Transcript_28965/m.79768 type:complete len:417 (+) Transcript_28965:74-1324(+)